MNNILGLTYDDRKKVHLKGNELVVEECRYNLAKMKFRTICVNG